MPPTVSPIVPHQTSDSSRLLPSPHRPRVSRRGLLGLGAAVAFNLSGTRPAAAWEPEPERSVHLYNCQTGESFNGVYWADDRPVPDALARIDWVLRDHHRDLCRRIDVALLHRLSEMQERLEADGPFEVLSAYRSLETNRSLIPQGAAAASLHLEGRAVDLRLPGRRTADLYRCALSCGDGGVGCYPRQHFVHVDSGPTRRWMGG